MIPECYINILVCVMYRSNKKINKPGAATVATLEKFFNAGKTKPCYYFQGCDIEFF